MAGHVCSARGTSSTALDNDWKRVWDNVSRADGYLAEVVEHWWDLQLPESEWLELKLANQFAEVIDYANSYQTEHKLEHMQQFWSHCSTTILGCVLKVAVWHLKDEFFAERAEISGYDRTAAEERMETLRVLAENRLPPEITIIPTTTPQGFSTSSSTTCIRGSKSTPPCVVHNTWSEAMVPLVK